MDNLSRVWDKFNKFRVVDLFNRFPGWYRALVVETNDPLQWHRIRFKCPELHDFDLKAEDCPWADRAPWLGGKNTGSWVHPCIGDIIWVTWEKNHPYGPIWVGFAMGTRRKRYPLESIYTKSPLALKLDETADERPDDFNEEYLPKDFRPMSHGWRDRYGSSQVNSSVGFFPVEHIKKPAPVGQDPISKKDFDQGDKPLVNDPDRKYCVEMTKYGNFTIQSDVGFYWKRPSKNEANDKFLQFLGEDTLGEFVGDFDEDRPFEIKRYKYLLRLLNEDQPKSEERDQRRYEIRTRVGHKFEMRDVGWAQKGGGRSGCDDAGETKSRPDEYDEPRVLSKWTKTDERWIKLRSKGGHLIQFMDMGFHPEEDEFYKRLLVKEVGPDIDDEKEAKWTERDARQIRIVTRWGIKAVFDDRGSDPKNAETKEVPRGNGWLFKTRRSWTNEPTTPRGFAIEAIDKDELNTTRWYTPKSKIVEMNDNYDYMMICTDTKTEISREWQKLKENEFALKVAMTENPEDDTYHLKLDKFNGYMRLKTAAGGDNGRRPASGAFSNADVGLNQGIEARDGRFGSDGAWAELVDIEHRGVWYSKNHKLGIWRSKAGKDQFILIHDGNNSIVIRNNEQGPMQLFCAQNIEIIAGQDIAFKAGGRISFKAGSTIDFEAAGSGHARLSENALTMDVPNNAPQHITPGASNDVLNPEPIDQEKREPDDRGESLITQIPEVNEKVVKMCE
jgi:hypothetical protein